MKRIIRSNGLILLVLLSILLLAYPAIAGQTLDLTGMSTDRIMSQMERSFDNLDAGYRTGHGCRDQKFADPDPFEFLMELNMEHRPADPDTGFPEYYRITGRLFPEVGFELRLPPRKEWNKRFYMTGCGGFCGNNDTTFPDGQFTNNLNWGLLRGYAAATTDSGHSSFVDGVNLGRTYGAWAENNRRGEIDWGYRSVHEVTRVCKALIRIFYHRPARYAYFAGCSTGGRMAMMEAIRYPEDFDGVISGAPALEYTGLVATWMSWIAQATDGVTFSSAEIESVRAAVLDQCDGVDGAMDGLIMDPRRCPKVDFSGLGLSGGQMVALDLLYSKPVNGLDARLYEGAMPYGSEIYWPIWVPGIDTTPQALGLGLIGPLNSNFIKYMAFQEDDPDFAAADFDFDQHPTLLDFMGKIYNATSPRLRAYQKMGGKIIMYHGWADSVVPPVRTITYYEAAVAEVGSLQKTRNFFRLFMVPGMDHCSTAQGLALGGLPFKSIGLDDFDVLTALEKWVEKGIAPDQILASGSALDGTPRSRPLFPYPLCAKYIGGDINAPDSFAPENDGSVRWNRFRSDTFYAFEIPGIVQMPLVEGEDVNFFQPYDHNLIPPGTYDWRVWSPSMLDGMDYDGYNGKFEKQ